jgi:hypothetical protein
VKVAISCNSGVVAIKSKKAESTEERKRGTRHGLSLNEAELGAFFPLSHPSFTGDNFMSGTRFGFPARTLPYYELVTSRHGCINKDDHRRKQGSSGLFSGRCTTVFSRYSCIHAPNDRDT